MKELIEKINKQRLDDRYDGQKHSYNMAIDDIIELIESHQQEVDNIRPWLQKFVIEMESELSRHDIEKGDNWKSMPMEELVNIFYSAMWRLKYVDVVEGKECNQLIDMANLAMMIWYRSISEG